jgi:hypothetical protein
VNNIQTLARHALIVGVLVLTFAVLGALAGCGTTMQTVKVPVPVECKEQVPDRPVMPTEQFKAKPTLDQYVQASQAEIQRREGYEKKLRTALEACTAPIEPLTTVHTPATKGASDGHTQTH